MKKWFKRLIALVLIIALISGGVYAGKRWRDAHQAVVSVYEVMDLAETDYWEDDNETYGTVMTDRVQTVYLSSTQKVQEVFVTEGQSVKKGDALMSYDTTLSQIELQRAQLEIQKLQQDMTKQQSDLEKVKKYEPGVPVYEKDQVDIDGYTPSSHDTEDEGGGDDEEADDMDARVPLSGSMQQALTISGPQGVAALVMQVMSAKVTEEVKTESESEQAARETTEDAAAREELNVFQKMLKDTLAEITLASGEALEAAETAYKELSKEAKALLEKDEAEFNPEDKTGAKLKEIRKYYDGLVQESLKAEEESVAASIKASEEASVRASEEEEEARRASEEASIKASEEEEARLASEEASVKASEEEEARLASEEASIKASEEEAARQASEEASVKASEEEAARQASEEASIKASEEEEARQAAEEEAGKASEEAVEETAAEASGEAQVHVEEGVTIRETEQNAVLNDSSDDEETSSPENESDGSQAGEGNESSEDPGADGNGESTEGGQAGEGNENSEDSGADGNGESTEGGQAGEGNESSEDPGADGNGESTESGQAGEGDGNSEDLGTDGNGEGTEDGQAGENGEGTESSHSNDNPADSEDGSTDTSDSNNSSGTAGTDNGTSGSNNGTSGSNNGTSETNNGTSGTGNSTANNSWGNMSGGLQAGQDSSSDTAGQAGNTGSASVQAVIDQINTIQAQMDSSRLLTEAARQAYEQLSPEDQAKVTNLNVLTQAEEALGLQRETNQEETSGEETSAEETSVEETSAEETSVEETSAEETSAEETTEDVIQDVIDRIDAIGELTEDRQEMIRLLAEDARKAYNALTDEEKALVTNFGLLEQAEGQLEAWFTDTAIPVQNYPSLLYGRGTLESPYTYEWYYGLEFNQALLAYLAQGQENAYVRLMASEGREENERAAAYWTIRISITDAAQADSDVTGVRTEISADSSGESLLADGYTGNRRISHRVQYVYELIEVGVGDEAYRFTETEPTQDSTEESSDMEESTDMDDFGDDDWGDGDETSVTYTAAEIADMRNVLEENIRDLDLEIRQAQLDYEKKKREMENSSVVSEIDGVIRAVRDADTARMERQALIEVSGGGGYYISGSVSELELGTVKVGQAVQVMSYDTGRTYEGVIQEISSFPRSDNSYWGGSGNSNASYYPFKVFVDESASLQNGEFVQLQYEAADKEGDTFYLLNSMIRTENGKSYVYVRGRDGLLKKQTVKTGKSIWGSYTEIKRGLSLEAWIAFPYGKDVREGLPTKEASADELWSYE